MPGILTLETKKYEIKIDNLELNKGTYKFQAHGSYGDNYNYDIKLSLIDN